MFQCPNRCVVLYSVNLKFKFFKLLNRIWSWPKFPQLITKYIVSCLKSNQRYTLAANRWPMGYISLGCLDRSKLGFQMNIDCQAEIHFFCMIQLSRNINVSLSYD